MQIEIAADSDLADAIKGAVCGEDAYIFLKSKSGKSVYRAIITGWKIESRGEEMVMTTSLRDWDSYWGEIAARRYCQ